MTPAEATRPVLIALAFASSLAVAGCGAVAAQFLLGRVHDDQLARMETSE